jgi:hypothetical protein
MARKVDRIKLRAEIKLKVEKDPEIKLGTRAQAIEVAEYWKNVAWPNATGSVASPPNHPYETGGYVESIDVKQGRTTKGRYAAHFIVEADHDNANFIEFGTGIDKPGSKSPWGPNTPTPEYGPAAATAHHFRGTAP